VRGVAALNAIYQRSDAAREAVLARASDLDGKSMADPTAPLTRWFGSDLTSARMACDAWLRDVAPAGYRAAYRVFAQEDGPSDALLSALTIPALFMTGAEEPNSTPAMSRAMAARAPNGRAVVVPDAAHMMPMTHAQEVTEAILALAQEAFA
jgi:pimeloyl-ACP methyl ester carboxylesterase